MSVINEMMHRFAAFLLKENKRGESPLKDIAVLVFMSALLALFYLIAVTSPVTREFYNH